MEKGSCSRNQNQREEVARGLNSVSHLNVSSDESNRNEQVVNVEANVPSRRPQRIRNSYINLKIVFDEEGEVDDGDVEYEANERDSNSAQKGGRNTNKRRRGHRRGKSTLSNRNIRQLMIPETKASSIVNWLIDSGTVRLGEYVCYVNWNATKFLCGYITREGILCGCCRTIFSIPGFEAHYGVVTDHPFMNLYIGSKITLFHCQLTAWSELREKSREVHPTVKYVGDSNDDICGVCGDGGDLLCCDNCPSTFHQNCLGIEVVPEGKWYCPPCSCKYCGMIGSRGNSRLLRCRQCEQMFHHLCIQEEKAPTPWDQNGCTFCGKSCSKLFEQLQNLVGIKIPLGSGITWSLIRSFDYDLVTFGKSFYKRTEYNSTLAAALALMEESFDPIIDSRTGINVLQNVICGNGSHLRRLNFSGFYTAVLEKGDVILSAASIRIHGTNLAEMPFISTRNKYRRRGLCGRLLNAIESTLRTYGIERLIIPSISQRLHTWINSYGFKHIEEPLKNHLRTVNLLTFPGTVQLQKVLLINLVNDSANNAAVPAGNAGVRINNGLVVPFPFDLNQPSEEELYFEIVRPTHGAFIVFNPNNGTIKYRRMLLQYVFFCRKFSSFDCKEEI